MNDVFIDPIIADLRRIHSSAFEHKQPTLVIRQLLTTHADAIHSAFLNGNGAVTFHLGSWCSAVVGKRPEQIMEMDLDIQQVCESVAREYGFADWQTVQNLEDQQLDQEFESAVENVIFGNVDELRTQLTLNPGLNLQRSRYGHSATLLHYLGANGIESQRQITPMNCVAIARCLIDHGADVNAHANMYGGGSTTLGLVLSSAHPAKAGVVDALAKLLKDAGAYES